VQVSQLVRAFTGIISIIIFV